MNRSYVTGRLVKREVYEKCRRMVLVSHMICAYALKYEVSSLELGSACNAC